MKIDFMVPGFSKCGTTLCAPCSRNTLIFILSIDTVFDYKQVFKDYRINSNKVTPRQSMSDYCVGMKADRCGRTGGFKSQLQQT